MIINNFNNANYLDFTISLFKNKSHWLYEVYSILIFPVVMQRVAPTYALLEHLFYASSSDHFVYTHMDLLCHFYPVFPHCVRCFCTNLSYSVVFILDLQHITSLCINLIG